MSKDVRGLGSWLKSHGPLCCATSSRHATQALINKRSRCKLYSLIWIPRVYTLGFALEEIDHALEEEEFVLFEFVLAFESLVDRCELLHGDFQVGLIQAVGILAQVI